MNEQVLELLNRTNLNWRVKQESLTTESGIIVDGHKAIVREDNNSVLAIHSDGYTPYQNEELMDLLHQVSGRTGLEVHRGGSFKGGGRIYVQLKSDDLKLGDDRIEGFLTGINSFDGSTSLAFGHSNTTISCMNTFFKVYANKTMQKVRHTKSLNIKIDEICRQLDVVLEHEKETFKHIVELSETRFDDLIKERVTRKLFDGLSSFGLIVLFVSPLTLVVIRGFFISPRTAHVHETYCLASITQTIRIFSFQKIVWQLPEHIQSCRTGDPILTFL